MPRRTKKTEQEVQPQIVTLDANRVKNACRHFRSINEKAQKELEGKYSGRAFK